MECVSGLSLIPYVGTRFIAYHSGEGGAYPWVIGFKKKGVSFFGGLELSFMDQNLYS